MLHNSDVVGGVVSVGVVGSFFDMSSTVTQHTPFWSSPPFMHLLDVIVPPRFEQSVQ